MFSSGPQSYGKLFSGCILNISSLRPFSYKCALNNLDIKDGSTDGRLGHMILRSSTCKINYVVLSVDNSLFLINLQTKHSTFSLKAHFPLGQNRGLQVFIQTENKNQEPRDSTHLQQAIALRLRAPSKDRRQNQSLGFRPRDRQKRSSHRDQEH